MHTSEATADVIVIGGGMLGSAIGYGLARAGTRVRLFDEGDDAFRAARGNFGLVWIQSKGLGANPYLLWSIESARLWPDFAAELRELTGVDVDLEQRGGLYPCISEKEAAERRAMVDAFHAQAGPDVYRGRFVSRDDAQALLPHAPLGERVVGGSHGLLDGATNPLRLLRAMLDGFARHRGRLHAGEPATAIERAGAEYRVRTARGACVAPRVVIAAGLGLPALARMAGLDVPVHPLRGQIIVTERTAPVLSLPMEGMRQTVEGTIMIGATHEEVGLDAGATGIGMRALADRAVAIFPALRNLRAMRVWGALRPLTPDGLPVYEESATHPGVFAVSSHSGVTLAAAHVRHLPGWILEGHVPQWIGGFGSERFRAQTAA